ncbi:MAG: hypothetical protein JWL90_1472, partial [Chthoniobacteraceae bacterium]|nr:hypothetical protein [Chthoniobacteraceae bacterium]
FSGSAAECQQARPFGITSRDYNRLIKDQRRTADAPGEVPQIVFF